MVQAFHVLAQIPVLPLRPEDKIDIVPANYVGKAIVTIHQKKRPRTASIICRPARFADVMN